VTRSDESQKGESSRWSLLRHPTERGEGRSRFDLAAEVASNLASSSFFFSVCLAIAAVWAVGLIVGLPSETESDLVGAMAALTLLLVALLKNSERRAERAMQLKLDAIAAALLDERRDGHMDSGTHTELEDAVRLHEEI
jgi:low affinity Fe/Cu permease